MSLDEDAAPHEIALLMQIKAMYDVTTDITKHCFDACCPKLTPRMDDAERNCMANCATNFMRMKLLFARRLIDSARTISATLVSDADAPASPNAANADAQQ